MKNLILLLLIIPSLAYGQFPTVAAWQSAAVAPSWTPPDSTKGFYVADDLVDSLSKADGDTTYIWPNRARFFRPYAIDNLYQTTGSKKPLVRDSSGVRWVSFDGVADALFADKNHYVQPVTYFVVAKHKSNTAYAAMTGGYDINKRQQMGVGPSSSLYLYAGAILGSANGLLSQDSLYLFEATFNGALSTMMMNAALVVTGDAGAFVQQGLVVGDVPTGAAATKLEVHEILVVTGTMTDPIRTAYRERVKDLYGVNLP